MHLRRALVALALLRLAEAQDLFLAAKGKSTSQVTGDASGSAIESHVENTYTVFTISPDIDELRCLDASIGADPKGAQLQLWECNGRENQLWYFDAGSNKIRWAGDSTKCLDAGSDMKPGNGLLLWDCNGATQQVWGYGSDKTIYLEKSTSASPSASLCMDLTGGSTDLGTKIELWGCNGHPNQKWILESGITIRTLFGFVYHEQDFCLDLPRGDTTRGVKVQLWSCNGVSNQKWVFEKGLIHPFGDAKKCLDAGAGDKAGTSLYIWDCNGTPQQQWGYDGKSQSIYLASSVLGASLCMDIEQGYLGDGAGIQTWGCNRCWNQIFAVVGPVSNSAATSSKLALWREVLADRNSSTHALLPSRSMENPDSCPPDPTPKVSGHCMSEAPTNYPVFKDQQSLSSSPWGKYFQLVYGEIPLNSNSYPICIANLALIYSDQAAAAGVTITPLTQYCPKTRGEYYSVMGWQQQGFTWIYNPVLSQPYSDRNTGATTGLPPFIWVEVMHMGYKQDGEASWMYYTPGSAVWLHLGATAVYADHPAASSDLLGHPCHQNPGDLPSECELDFPLWYSAAIKRGLDTLQFLYHADARCAVGHGSGNMAIEIVDIHGPGRHSCSGFSGISRFRAGWEAKSLCNCDDTKETINCKGFGMWH